MKLLLTNLKHFLITLTILAAIAIGVAVKLGADIFYGDNDLAYKVGNEGPHIFYEGDEYVVNYIRGDSDNGFDVEKARYEMEEQTSARVFFPLENNSFEFEIDSKLRTPELLYQDDEPIVAMSDLESGFSTFRDFLIANKIIDSDLNWIFGKGHLFAHGGLHPDIANTDLTLHAANNIVRRNYRQAYFRKTSGGVEDLLTSTRTGLAWYRGFFEAGASEERVQRVLDHFDASAIVVGHQPQSRVRSRYSGKVWAINVKHPRDYRGSFPERRSEGLLITNGQYFRLLDDGAQIPI